MVTIKGVNLSSTLNYNKEMFGEELQNKLIAQLSSEDQQVLTKAILDAEWYPLDVFVRYLNVMTKDILKGSGESLQKGTEAVIEMQFKGIYKALLMLGSPEAFVERINTITGRYYQGINIKTEMLDKKKVKATYEGFEKSHRLYEYTILGWWKKAMEMLGAKNVKVELLTSLADGKGHFELTASWE